MNALLKKTVENQIRNDLPQIKIGDTVQVGIKIKEGNRERVQVFEGTVIAMKNGKLPSATLTVRRISFGVGIEKTFMLNGPTIDTIKVVRHGKARRAKLFFLRDRVGKAAKLQEKLSNKVAVVSDNVVEEVDVMEPVVEEVAETSVPESVEEVATENADELATETPADEVQETPVVEEVQETPATEVQETPVEEATEEGKDE